MPYELLTAEAAATPPGAEGLIFLPYLTGERTPHGSASARGVFFGLQPRHGRGHLTRAVIEGVSFALGQCLTLLRGAGVTADSVRITGGGARSPFWRGVLADVFDCPVVVQPHDEGPAYGAALLAAVGAGAFATIEAAGRRIEPGEIVVPRPEGVERYRRSAALYGALYHRTGTPLSGTNGAGLWRASGRRKDDYCGYGEADVDELPYCHTCDPRRDIHVYYGAVKGSTLAHAIRYVPPTHRASGNLDESRSQRLGRHRAAARRATLPMVHS